MIRTVISIFLSTFAFAAHAIPEVACTMNVTETPNAKTLVSHSYSDATVLVSTYPANANVVGFNLSADMIAQSNHYVVRLNLSNDKLETGTQFYLANSDEPITVSKDQPIVTLQVGDRVATVRCRQYSF